MIFNNALLRPERGDGNKDQAEKFTFDDPISKWVEFEFQGNASENYSEEAIASGEWSYLACDINDLEFEAQSWSSVTRDILGAAEGYANAFSATPVDVKEGPDDEFSVQLMEPDGSPLGRVTIDVWINESLAETLLPNGDKLEDLRNYSWKEFKELENMAKEWEAAHKAEDEFAAGVDSIPEPGQSDDMQQ